MAWQIAQNDPIYRKDLAKNLRDSADFGDIAELWDKLFIGHYASDATFFIVLDGIDGLEKKYELVLLQLLKAFQARPQKLLRMKLLFTGRVDALESIKAGLKSPLPTIDVALKNGDEIAKYVRRGIDNMQILKGSNAQIQALRDEVYVGLTENAKGDFINIDLLLEEISRMQRPNEIRSVLEKAKAGTDRSDNFAQKIERINQTLGADDIQDLNMLLTWVIRAFRTLTVSELEAVLYTRKIDSNLRPLQDRIKEEFSIFFDVRPEEEEGGGGGSSMYVAFKADTIVEYFEKTSKNEDKGTSSIDTSISEVEVKVFRQFLRSICDQELFTKFQFEEFFQNKLD